MKSRVIKIVLLGLLAIASFTSSAGVVNKELEKMVEENSSRLASDPNLSSLRCWQKGKLLFEEVDWRAFNLGDKKNILTFSHKTLRNQTLSLIDLGETVCVYRKVD